MKRMILMPLFLSLFGCVGTNTAIERAVLPTLKGKTLVLVTHESPAFIAMTSGKGMFAVAGVAAAAAAGNNLVQENQIADPAAKISHLLAQDLGSRYGLSVNGQSSKKSESKDMAEIVKVASGSDYALDVMTNGWRFLYDGFNFSEYLVDYTVKMRLIDVANSKSISEGFCFYSTKHTGNKPNVTYEKLMENNAAHIKQTLEDATSFCVEKFKTELF